MNIVKLPILLLNLLDNIINCCTVTKTIMSMKKCINEIVKLITYIELYFKILKMFDLN